MKCWLRHPRSTSRRPFGVRLYLAFAFAGVALLTAGFAYLLVSETGETAADERLPDLAQGRTVNLAIAVGDRPERQVSDALDPATEPGFSAWVFDRKGSLITPRISQGVSLDEVPQYQRAVNTVRRGA